MGKNLKKQIYEKNKMSFDQSKSALGK